MDNIECGWDVKEKGDTRSLQRVVSRRATYPPIKVLSNVLYMRMVNLAGNSFGIVRLVALGIVVTHHEFFSVPPVISSSAPTMIIDYHL